MTQIDIANLIKALVNSLIISLVILVVINVFTYKFFKKPKSKSELNLKKIQKTDFDLKRYSRPSSISLVLLNS